MLYKGRRLRSRERALSPSELLSNLKREAYLPQAVRRTTYFVIRKIFIVSRSRQVNSSFELARAFCDPAAPPPWYRSTQKVAGTML